MYKLTAWGAEYVRVEYIIKLRLPIHYYTRGWRKYFWNERCPPWRNRCACGVVKDRLGRCDVHKLHIHFPYLPSGKGLKQTYPKEGWQTMTENTLCEFWQIMAQEIGVRTTSVTKDLSYTRIWGWAYRTAIEIATVHSNLDYWIGLYVSTSLLNQGRQQLDSLKKMQELIHVVRSFVNIELASELTINN